MTLLNQLLFEADQAQHQRIKHVCEFDLGWEEGEDFEVHGDTVIEGAHENALDIDVPWRWSQLPVKFGKMPNTRFKAWHSGLGSLEGSPAEVKSFTLQGASRLASLKGGPEVCREDYLLIECGLTSLQGAPTSIGGMMRLIGLSKLMNLKGLEDTAMHGDLDISECDLRTLDGMPKEIGRLIINRCENLEVIDLPRDMEIKTGLLLVSAGMEVKMSPRIIVTKGLHEIDYMSEHVGFRDDIIKLYNKYLQGPKTNKQYLELQAELIDRDLDWLAEL